MGLRLPSELLFEVIAELVCDYVDFAITGPLPIEDCHQNLLPDRRHIHACLFVSSQFQEILLKVLFYTLGEDWRSLKNPWSRLLPTRKAYHLGSQGHGDFRLVQQPENISPLLRAYNQLSHGLFHFSSSRDNSKADEPLRLELIFKSAWEIRPNSLKPYILRRVGDLLCSSVLSYRVHRQLLHAWTSILLIRTRDPRRELDDATGILADLEQCLSELADLEQDSLKHYHHIHQYTDCSVPKVTREAVVSGAGRDLCVTIASNIIFAQRKKVIELGVTLATQWSPLFTKLP